MRKPERLRSQPVRSVDQAVELAEAEREMRFSQRVDALAEAMGSPADLSVRNLADGVAAVYLTTMVDAEGLREAVISPLSGVPAPRLAHIEQLMEFVTVGGITEPLSLNEAADGVAEGKVALVVEDRVNPYLIDVSTYVGRKVGAAATEPAVLGPHDAFNESLQENMALIRYRIRNRNLTFRRLVLGADTGTQVLVVYVKGKASEEMVDKVVRRLESADTPVVLDTAFLREYITGHVWSPFPLAASTERPDRVCGEILQGRVAILCDSSPFALIVPAQFVMLLHASADSYDLPLQSLLLRLVRVIGWLVATMAPALYIVVSSFSPGILPPNAVMSIQAARQGVPYPPIIEVLIMDLALELLAEASVRLPANVGGAATVVGGLILGTAASEARLVSNVMIIVVAATAIGTFALPGYQNQMSWRLTKYLFTAAAALLGLTGLVSALLLVAIYLCSIDVLDTPYMSPLAPWRWTALAKDTLVRLPQPWTVRLERRQRQEEAKAKRNAG